MRILFVCQYFPPEMGANSARVSELARHWVKAGHDVTVLTGFPNYPTGKIFPGYKKSFRRLIAKEKVDGINVVRTWLLPKPNRRPVERILNYTSFCISASFTGMFLRRSDVVIATSPQLLVGITGWWLGLIKRIPFILEIRDLWPESITASGVGTNASILIRLVNRLVGFLYRSCDHLVTVTPAQKDDILTNWNLAPGKISVVTNGVETEFFTPDGSSEEVKKELGFEGKFVISYIGTLGMAHGLTTALEAASAIQHAYPNIIFLFVGEGAEKENLISKAQQMKLSNIQFLPQQPKDRMPGVIRASDICLVLLKKRDIFRTVLPTKMLEFMACGRPIILGVEGQALEIMEQAQSGIAIEPENADALVGAVLQLQKDTELRHRLGNNGRIYVLENFSREETATAYLDLIAKVVSKQPRRRIACTTDKEENT